MSLKKSIGNPARDKAFFDRPKLVKQLWEAIESGSHILLAAPRRVGKTSLMFKLHDEPQGKYEVVYIITQSVNDSNEYFKRIFRQILETLEGVEKFSGHAKELVKKILGRISEIRKDGVALKDNEINYFEELKSLIKNLKNKEEKIIVLMVDEFPETVENIINDKSEKEAIKFLQQNRDLRIMPEINEKIQFVYAGSIGLENIVSRINASETINDLNRLKIAPLNKKEAGELIEKLVMNEEYSLQEKQIEYIINKVDWLIPFYIQLIIDEIGKLDLPENGIVTNRNINNAIEEAISHRNHFENWLTRLRIAFKGNEFSFVIDVLNKISLDDSLSYNEIHDMAVGCEVDKFYKNILNSLEYDGYINNLDDEKCYRFNSPILKAWWRKYVAN